MPGFVGPTVSRAPTVLTAASPADKVATLGGGKGGNLFRLTHGGLPVPAWSIIGADAFERLRTETGLGREIAATLDGLTLAGAIEAAERIEAAVQRTPLDDLTLHAVSNAYSCVGTTVVAVRSSALEEDGAEHSFAGQHASFLNITNEQAVIECVRACWASAYSARALVYRLVHRLDSNPIQLAVVLQALVPADKSGVLFTLNPTTGDSGEFLVSSVFGLGEGLVSGAIDADTLVVERSTGAVTHTVIGDKKERFAPRAEGEGCVLQEVPQADRERLSLTPGELAVLRAHGERIETLLGGPQDIEWAIAGADVAILQSRPVTGAGPGPLPDGELRIWDNSNIVESFGDLTTPLTFSFACHVYHRVYHEYCELLGVPQRHLAQMDEWLPNMLGSFNGRVYYNLLNWYRVIRLLPFYRANRRILEMSMGVDEPLSEPLAELQRPFVPSSRAEEIMIRAVVALRFAGWFLVIDRLVDRFVADFSSLYEQLDSRDPAELHANELFALYRAVEQQLLKRWGRMILLEATLGLSIGALYALTRRWLPDAPPLLIWEATKIDDTVESAEQARQLERMAHIVRDAPTLREKLAALAPDKTVEGLRRATAGEPAAAHLLDAMECYLEQFGHRSANELKLEEPDLREDPAPLFAQLRGAITRLDIGVVDHAAAHPGADAYLARELSWWRARVYGVVRRKVQRSLAARERVRLCRTRAFGLTRRVFKAIGRDLAAADVLPEGQDIFLLRLDELRCWFDGMLSERDLRPLVELRRAAAERDRGLDAPTRFTTRGAASPAAVELAWRQAQRTTPPTTGMLRGTPCSPGLVEGKARLVDRPRDVEGDVLVAYHTDPGWIAALPSASALLIERGSPLTHVAIVARELGIPTIVQVRGLTRRLQDGARVRVNGEEGTIEILDGSADA